MKREGRSIFESFRDAFRGLGYVARSERNFRIHICMAIYVIYFSIVASVSVATASVFLICFGLVFALELVNTAIEMLCDMMTEEYDERIGRIKDISAAAVLLSALFSAAVGLFVFLSPETFGRIVSVYFDMPCLLIAFPGSVPIACLYIAKRRKK